MSDFEKEKLFEKITEALQRGAKKARLEHKLSGQPMAISDKNGNIKWIKPEDIVVD